MQNQLLTCNLATESPYVLIGVGFEHDREFAIYGEADHNAVAFVVHAINLETLDKLETGMLAPAVSKGPNQVVLQLELTPGKWLLSLETVTQGVIARREIGIRDEFTEA